MAVLIANQCVASLSHHFPISISRRSFFVLLCFNVRIHSATVACFASIRNTPWRPCKSPVLIAIADRVSETDITTAISNNGAHTMLLIGRGQVYPI